MILRSITRYVPRWGWQYPPSAQEVEVRLVQYGTGVVCINTPWACLPGALDTTDAEMLAALHVSFDTHDDALNYARRQAPYWQHPSNQTVSSRIHDAIRWRDELVGVGALADALEVTREQLYAIGRGEVKATRKQAEAAHNYRGGKI